MLTVAPVPTASIGWPLASIAAVVLGAGDRRRDRDAVG